MSRNSNKAFVFLILSIAQISSAVAAGGARPPRWTSDDIAGLNADLHSLVRARKRLAASSIPSLAIERQRQLLGHDGSPQRLFEETKEWWRTNIREPAFSIANNPAASCRVSQIVLSELLGAERQRQLLGIEPPGGTEHFDLVSSMNEELSAVKRRCLEQAFDACMESGNGQHLVAMLVGATRQFQMLGIEGGEFEAQAVYLYRRCAVYKLRYHSQSRLDSNAFTFGQLEHGSIILLSDVEPASGLAGLFQSHEWHGAREADPIDLLQSTTECIMKLKRQHAVCGPSQPLRGARATIKTQDLSMTRYYNDVEIVNDGVTKTTRKSEGTDALTLTFEPSVVMGMYAWTTPDMTMQLPMPPQRVTLLKAHGRNEQATLVLSDWTRVGSDVLFERSISGQQTEKKLTYTDTSKFELVHRPDLFPQEEIIQKWELTTTPPQSTLNRKPTQPGGRTTR